MSELTYQNIQKDFIENFLNTIIRNKTRTFSQKEDYHKEQPEEKFCHA